MNTMTVYLVIALLIYMSCSAPSRAEIAVQQGELSNVSSSEALLRMSGDSMLKLAWWQFLPQLQSTPEAFLRYLISPPVPENQLWNQPACSDEENYQKQIQDNGGLLATRNLSIAEYQSKEHIKSVGDISINMWMLAFACLSDDQACYSLAPVVLRSIPQSNTFIYNTLWEFNSGQPDQLSNSVPSRIAGLPNDYWTNTSDSAEYQLRSLPWESSLQTCGVQELDILSSRSVSLFTSDSAKPPTLVANTALDAGFYNYSSKCYTMDDDFEKVTGTKSLQVLGPVFLPEYVSNCSGSSDDNLPVLFSNTSGFYACSRDKVVNSDIYRFSCAQFGCDEASAKSNLVPYFEAVYRASKVSNDSEIKLAESQTCLEDSTSIRVVAEYTREANYTSSCEIRRAAKEQLCLMGISPPKTLLNTTSEVSILKSFLSQVKSSYIQAHVSAFNLDQGPPTDFWLLAITLPSAFFAVLSGVAPLTNAQMKLVNRFNVPRSMVTPLLCFCNLVLALVSYSAVVALTPAELQRQKQFKTWGIHTDQVQVTSNGLRVLIFAHGESKYRSGSLLLVWLSTLVLVPPVVLITYWKTRRLERVFGPSKKELEMRLPYTRSYTK